MVNENPFKKEAKASETAEVPAKAEETSNSKTSGRQVIDENSVQESNWVNLPKKDAVGEATPDLKIAVNGYYTQEGKEQTNSKTGDKFYTGLSSGKGSDYKEYGEFIVEGIVNDETASLRLSNWEVKIKMDALVRYCRDNNFTIANQVISFKRINSGQENAGENWELLCPSLKVVVSGKDNEIKKF